MKIQCYQYENLDSAFYIKTNVHLVDSITTKCTLFYLSSPNNSDLIITLIAKTNIIRLKNIVT